MSLSTYVCGIKPADEKFNKMKAIYELCVIMHIQIPNEVEKYFNYEEPMDSGVRVEIPIDCYEKNGLEIEVDISKLDKDIKIIKFEVD